MIEYKPNEPLISIHLPKCGGSSLTNTLKTWFGKRLFYHYYNDRKSIPPKKHKLKQGFFRNSCTDTCVHGHFNRTRGIGANDYYPDVKQYIMIMRDPFDIAVSYYFYTKKKGENFYSDNIFQKETPSLQLFLEETPSYIPDFMPTEVSTDTFSTYFDEHFIYIGILEDIQTSIDQLAKKLGKPTLKIEHTNSSIYDEKIYDEVALRAHFRNRNQLAYKMYDYACSHYKS